MKKKYQFLILTLLFIPVFVKAETNVTGYITAGDTLIASKANVTVSGCLNKVNGSYNSNYAAPGKLHCLDSGETIKILNYDSMIASSISACSKGYYKAEHTTTSGKTYTGYVCADKVQTNIDTGKYENELNKFPASYRKKLALLKQIHPNWVFTPYNTNIDWQTATKVESTVGMSYIQSTNPLYLSIEEGSYNAQTGKYSEQEAGGFYAANQKTVAYYMDPRNFLDEMNVFQFENLGYNSNYQTKDVVDSILSGTALAPYANYFMQAATYDGNSVSPVSLAARSRQEVVRSDKTLSASANGSRGYYNFYNLGAWSSCANPIDCAIDFASGYSGRYSSYNRPWTNPEIAIKGGAKYLADGYINKRQNTLYFQKWDVVNYNGNFNHQYMTNIKAAINEGKNTWKSYKNINVLSKQIEFLIPVYNNMPDTASTLPTTVEKPSNNQGNNQNSGSQPSTKPNISSIILNAGYRYSSNYLTEISVGTTASSMINNLRNKGASVSIITVGSNNVAKKISSNEVLGTGDTVTIGNGVTSGKYRVVVKGDANGDGRISAVDYVKIKNYIMSSSSLSGSYKEAADVNKDGRISAVDYVKIKNYIMGNRTF